MAASLADVLLFLLPWLGWLPALSLVGTCKTIVRPEAQRYLQQALCKHVPNLAPAGSFRLQIRQLFMVLMEPFLDLASSHAPRPPSALVRPEKRVHCRYYNASKWKYQGTVAEGATERLCQIFPHGGFVTGFRMLRQHGTHLKVVYDSEQYDYGAHEVLEEWTCLYFVLDGMFELRLIMRYTGP